MPFPVAGGNIAKLAYDNADEAKQTANSVRDEFDRVVAEAGSNNPEVVQARGEAATLKERLDTNDALLADNATTPEKHTGTDFQKLQKALDEMFDTGKTLRLTKMYDITGHTLVLKKTGELPRVPFSIVGTGGGIIKNDGGFFFDAPVGADNVGDIQITNVHFKGTEGTNATVFNARTIIRVKSYFNFYEYVDHVMDSGGDYAQSMYFIGDSVIGGKGWAYQFGHAFDLTIQNCIIEWREHGIGNVENFLYKNMSLRIVNNCIEGLTGHGIRLYSSDGLLITGNYMEWIRGSYIDLSQMNDTVATVEGNMFHLYDDQVSSDQPVIYWGKSPNLVQSSKGNRTNGGILHQIPNETIVMSAGDTNEFDINKLAGGAVNNLKRMEDLLMRDVELVKTYFDNVSILNTSLVLVAGNNITKDTLTKYKEIYLVVKNSLRDGAGSPVITEIIPYGSGGTPFMWTGYTMTVTDNAGGFQLIGKDDSKALLFAGGTDLNFAVRCTTAPTQGTITIELYGVPN